MPVACMSSRKIPVRDRAIVASAHTGAGERDTFADLEQLRGRVPAQRLQVLRGERLLLLRERRERGLEPARDAVRAREDDARSRGGDEPGELGDGPFADIVEHPHGGQTKDRRPLGLRQGPRGAVPADRVYA